MRVLFSIPGKKRVPAECIPAFNRMGGVWSESYGHGAYGPVTVIPYAFHAWRTATGLDLFKQLEPWGYPVESPRWVAYTMMPTMNAQHGSTTAMDLGHPHSLAPPRCCAMVSPNGSQTAATSG